MSTWNTVTPFSALTMGASESRLMELAAPIAACTCQARTPVPSTGKFKRWRLLIYLIKSSAIEDRPPGRPPSTRRSLPPSAAAAPAPPRRPSAAQWSPAGQLGKSWFCPIEKKKNHDQASDPDDSVVVCSRMVWEARGINQLTSFLHRGSRARPRILRTRPSLLPPLPRSLSV